MATQAQVLQALMAKLDAQDAAISALAARFEAPAAVAAPAVNGTAHKPATAPATTGTVSMLTGTLSKVAAHHKGAQLDGDDKWFNATKDGGPIFEGYAVGQTVVLTLNEHGRVTMVQSATVPGPKLAASKTTSKRPAATPPNVAQRRDSDEKQAAREAAQETVTARGPRNEKLPLQITLADGTKRCALCSGPVHGKDSAETVARNCAMRQFETATASKVTVLDPDSYARFSEWLATTVVIVGAYTDTGRARIGGTRRPEPPTPGPKSGKGKAASKPASKAQAPQVSAPEPSKPARKAASDAEIVAITEKMVAAPAATPTPKPATTTKSLQGRAGTYTGIVAQHSKNTPGLVKIVSTDLPGCKAVGDWLGAKLPQVIAAVVKAQMNDRVSFTLQGKDADEQIIGFKIVSTVAKDTGKTPGVETSGKQQPAAPKKQPTDPKVAKARETKRQARTQKMTEAEYEAATAKAAAELKAEFAGTDDASIGWQPIATPDGSVKGAANKRKRVAAGKAELCESCGRRFTMVKRSAPKSDTCALCANDQE